MTPEKTSTVPDRHLRLLPTLTAAVVTTATFAKAFVPFYLIGSTPIFAVTCAAGVILIVMSWRQLIQDAFYVTDILIAMGVLYGIVTASFLVNSLHRVPATDLIGILVFHALFIIFGFAAARGLKAVFAMLLAQAAIYLIVVIQYTIRFGDLMEGGVLHDIFDLKTSIFMSTFHQQIGTSFGLATLAALGFGSSRIRLLALISLPFVFAFLFHIASRGAIVSLAGSLLFMAWANLWVRSKKLAIGCLAALLVVAVVGSSAFYRFALQDANVSAVESDAVSRTIKEIQSDNPEFRLPIWERTWQRILSDPHHLLLGKGIGSFAIDEGVGPPDWLIRKTEGAKHTPHNIHLDMLYESGALGILLFTIVAAFPVVLSLGYWTELSAAETSTMLIYIFWLIGEEIGGSFAVTYDFQFFLALAIGVIALKRKEFAAAS